MFSDVLTADCDRFSRVERATVASMLMAVELRIARCRRTRTGTREGAHKWRYAKDTNIVEAHLSGETEG